MAQHLDHQSDKVPLERLAGQHKPAPSFAGAAHRGVGPEVEPETILWRGRTSWKNFVDLIGVVLAWSVVAVVVGLSAGGWIGWFMFIISSVGWALVVVRVALGVLYHHYRLTTQRLFVDQGILSKTLDQTELIRVDDIRITKSMCNRLMGLGNLLIMSTDTSDPKATLIGVTEPEKLADIIRERVSVLRAKSLYVERL